MSWRKASPSPSPSLARDGRYSAVAIGSPVDIAPATAELLTALASYVDSESVIPVVDSVYSLEASGGFGKRVIQVTQEP